MLYQLTQTTDETTGISKPEWKAVTEEKSCKLSFSSTSAAEDPNGGEAVTQQIKLFTADKIPAGSRVEVTRNGEKLKFICAGIPENYFSHFEIYLKPVERWA